MNLFKKLFGMSAEGKTIARTGDMRLPAKLVNHILMVANTENKSENGWWEKVGLMEAFESLNNEFFLSFKSRQDSNFDVSVFCVPPNNNKSEIEIASAILKQKHPNDSHIYQGGVLGSPGKAPCKVLFGIAFSTPNDEKPFIAMINIPSKIMPSDRVDYPK